MILKIKVYLKGKKILKIDTDTENQFLTKVSRYFKDKNVGYAPEFKGKTKSNAYEQLLKRFESIYKAYLSNHYKNEFQV